MALLYSQLLPVNFPRAPFYSGMCILEYPEEEQIFQANSLSGAFPPPLPPSEFTVKVFLNFSLPAPAPPLRNPPRALQTVPLGFPRPPLPTSTQSGGDHTENKGCHWAVLELQGPPPEWFVNGGRGEGGAARNPASATLLLRSCWAPRRYSALPPGGRRRRRRRRRAPRLTGRGCAGLERPGPGREHGGLIALDAV